MAISVTARDLIASSLRLIGVLSQGETAGAADETDAFNVLNQLIDEWETQHLTALTRTRAVFDLVANDGTYTIGPTGQWVAVRPTDIETITILRTALTPDQESLPLMKMTPQMWQVIPDKDATGPEPVAFYYEATSPNGTISLYPIPDNATNDAVVYTATKLTQFTDRTTAVTLPPAYAKALRWGLAVELAPEFGRPLDPLIKLKADEAVGHLKQQNVRLADLAFPSGMGGDGGIYDIYSDH